MQAQQDLSGLQFVNLHVVDKNYHELHSQLKYVMYRKIGESQNLLMNTELPIGTISVRMALDAVKKAGVKLQIGFVRRFDHNHRGVYKEGRPVKISEVDV